ncbi:polyprenyl synthetase family protein [Anaeropeptidivorans aminofermentans]|uniref:polyprenyl synthetase family protein n=1 Tax=Anaeropeptidivorans aminofermentans TaxID=2934315 RepID=UPI002025A786|nr:farnesyl diphosphate synthase [Anaeropeptidivorans aminofermentans]
MNEYIEIINNRLYTYLDIKYPDIISEAMRYSVFAGGKRVRPALALLSTKALGSDFNKTIPFACALEMIHAYSLIHDDLPAMDNDDYRRGKLTNHKVYGEAVAILAGDALLNTAYEIMTDYALESVDINSLKAMSKIAKASGIDGMIGGQVVDILSDGKIIEKEILTYIHENKTAALIKAAMASGAIMAGADDEIVRQFELSGYYLGMAFQIKDDILDVEGNASELGKSIGSDAKNHKNTYVSLYGMERAKKDYEEFSSESVQILLRLSLYNNDIINYAESLLNRKS